MILIILDKNTIYIHNKDFSRFLKTYYIINSFYR